jgi:TetR/AcrR family transcriptional regulator, transcriptional repressor for nem operon
MRLLSSGRDVVHKLGFNGCGVEDITAAAGVPKGSFYNYFDSKESFATEILEAYWQSIEDRHGPTLHDGRAKPLARVRKFFHGLVQDHRESGFVLGCLIGNLSLELSSRSDISRLKIRDLLRRWERLLVTCLREAQERKDLDGAIDIGELAAILVESYEGAVMRSKIEQNGKACERFEKALLSQLLR